MNTLKRLAPLALALGALSLSGCMSTTPHWDARFGEAARAAVALQVIDPEAARNPDPVTGVDGKAAHGALEQYHKSFTRPAPAPQTLTIGVGGGAGR